jgi:hypothetical protein
MMLLFSEFYKNGIGTPVDSTSANFWNEEWKKSLRISIGDSPDNINFPIDPIVNKMPRKSLLSNRFHSFLTYTYSPTMPFGFTAGIYLDKIGGYVSGRTSSKSLYAVYECNNEKVPAIGIEDPRYEFARERWYSRMITGGVMYPIVKNKFFLSVGGGYGERDYYREIVTESVRLLFSTGNRREWCYNTEASYKGPALEVGGMFIWKKMIVSGGFNSTKFKDFDIYLGLGLTF